jgi:hypothetical protein
MQCGPIRYQVNARIRAAADPVEHLGDAIAYRRDRRKDQLR